GSASQGTKRSYEQMET
nr:Chain B, Peptide from Nucleoprotein [Influenza A virus (A/Puerto Rico/8/1934(H1N1))]